MKTKNANNSTFFGGLLGTPTKEKYAGVAFSLAVVAPVVVTLLFMLVGGTLGIFTEGYEKAEWYKYAGFLLSQIAFALVIAFFFVYSKTPFLAAVGKCKPKYFGIAVLLQIGLLSLSELNGLFLQFLQTFGYVAPEMNIPSLDGFGFVGALIVVALLPAVFEEGIFRGILRVGLSDFSTWAGALVSGALFSIFHMNPAQTLYQFACGACFALVASRSGSVLPTVLSHFLNNAFVLVLMKFGVDGLPAPWNVLALIISALCLAATLAYLIFFDKSNGRSGEKADKKGFFLCAAVGIFICAVTWITGLF